jgi:hypothetical protein
MARPVRFELTTPCSGGMYSIHLSYGRAGTNESSLSRRKRQRQRAVAAAESGNRGPEFVR